MKVTKILYFMKIIHEYKRECKFAHNGMGIKRNMVNLQ